MNELSAQEQKLLTGASKDESKAWLYRLMVVLTLAASACSVAAIIITAIGIFDHEFGHEDILTILYFCMVLSFLLLQLGHFMFRRQVFSLIRKLRKMVPHDIKMSHNQPLQPTNGG